MSLPAAVDARRPETDLVAGYRRLTSVLALVLSEHSLDEVLARIADALRGLVECEDVVVWESDGRELAALYAEGADSEAIRRLRIPVGRGLAGIATETGVPLWANDAHLDPRAELVPGTERVPEAIICIPLRVREQLLGVLSLYRTGDERAFDEHEFELSQHFAQAAAIAIDNARTRAELERLATTDDLTRIGNRRRFHDELEHAVAAAHRYGQSLSLLLLDLDRFKNVNDRLGHDAGDQVLQTVAAVLADSIRECDLAARIGGDEFALLLPQTSTAQATALAARIAAAIEQETEPYAIDASFGIAAYRPYDRGHDLFTRADRDLYAHKRDLQHRVGTTAA
jgi:diguanylate cyclase (GGDEF)-like protein